TNTWVNYAVPINARVRSNVWYKSTVGITDLMIKKEKYRPVVSRNERNLGGGGWSGITLVPNVVERTPPYIDVVDPGSPAARAVAADPALKDMPGLKPDDLIVYVDGLPVAHINAYRKIIEQYRPETEVTLVVRRSDRLLTYTLKLTTPPKGTEKET